jgi:hypothetical protein
MADTGEQVAQFVSIADCSAEQARFYLDAYKGNFEVRAGLLPWWQGSGLGAGALSWSLLGAAAYAFHLFLSLSPVGHVPVFCH